jgi:hypothetical protein
MFHNRFLVAQPRTFMSKRVTVVCFPEGKPNSAPIANVTGLIPTSRALLQVANVVDAV